jgi:hypothetical protein
MGQRLGLDVGDERLAAITGAQAANVVSAQIVQKRRPVRATHDHLRSLGEVDDCRASGQGLIFGQPRVGGGSRHIASAAMREHPVISWSACLETPG